MGRDVPRWVAPAVAGCLAMALVLAGTGAGGVFIVVVLAVAAVAVAAARRRPAAAVLAEGDRWPGIPVAAPVVGGPGHPRQLATALARIEARELFFCAWFGAGLGFLAVIVLAYAVVFPDDNGDVWAVIADQVPWFAHPIAGMTILAVHRGATRPARDGTDDLFASCPSGESVRVAALLRTAVVPVAAVVVFLVVLFAGLWLNSPGLHGGLVASSLPSMVAGPVLVMGAAFMGVALGVWTRLRLAPAVAVVVVGFLSLRLATAGDPGWNRLSALSTFGPQMDSPLLYPLAHTWPYVVWMAALSGLVALVAVVRFQRDRVSLAWGCALVVLALVAGVLAVRPVSGDDARRVDDLIARPADHQTCSTPSTSATVSVSVCTFASYGELRRRVASAVSPVGQALPVGVPAITVRQGFDGTLSDLPSEVRRLLPAGIPAPAAGELRIGFAGDDDALLAYRLRVAFQALGLPLGPEAGGLPYVNDDEARGVVALWLAVRGLPVSDARHLVRPLPGDDAFERGQAWPQMCGPVVWSPQDLAAARSVLALDEATVASVVAAGWARWSDPATSTDALLASLDLPSAGPYDQVTPRRERFC